MKNGNFYLVPTVGNIVSMKESLVLNGNALLKRLHVLMKIKNMEDVRKGIARITSELGSNGQVRSHSASALRISRSFLLGELKQIEQTRTLERARYYLSRLSKALTSSKTSDINDMNLHRWKEYSEVLTDSLWVLDRRDSSGGHSAWYWGNFVPQIPRQLMLRYTKRGDWVLDPFAGSGTTLLEAKRLRRNCLGIELQPRIASRVRKLLGNEKHGDTTVVIEAGDSREVDLPVLLQKHQCRSVQLAILHPPYHDIIQFSRKRSDLSNARSTDDFLKMFGRVVENVARVLDPKRYLAVVIGDKYEGSEWIPLGFRTMEVVLNHGFRLKSIVVKNFDETLGKRGTKELWRYRALAAGFYVFKHEYIFIFQKSA
jgi:DNA modification methylase